MTRILLARHGHVDWIAPERFRGRADLALSPLGERQAEALARRIAQDVRPDAIYASPLSRCVRTAAAVADATATPATLLEDLIDTDYGQWQGLTRDDVRARWPDELHVWLTAPALAQPPGGETLADVMVRALNVLRTILHRHAGRSVVLVAHDSINRVLLLHALGLPLASYWRLRQEPCCINEIEAHDGGFTIHRINDAQHTWGLRADA